jgi:hypothetical protein
VHRLALAVLVGLLAFSASGVSEFVSGEPCSFEARGSCTDQECAPLCVMCGCCAQSVETAEVIRVDRFEAPVEVAAVAPYRLLKPEPRDVLHVPRPAA